MKIHSRTEGELCAFCGNKISDHRWQLLGTYFNENVKKLEEHIGLALGGIESALTQINDMKKIKIEDYYDAHRENAKNIKSQLESRQNEYVLFLKRLTEALEGKREQLFIESVRIENNLPVDFTEIKEMCNELVEQHNEFSKNLNKKQDDAKNTLRYHEVMKELNKYGYEVKKQNLDVLKKIEKETQKLLNDEEKKLQQQQNERKNLIM